MRIDVNIGGSIDGTGGADLEVLADQVRLAEQLGFDGVWSTEVSRDPFLPLVLAAAQSSTLQIGTAVAVAFRPQSDDHRAAANDLNTFSRGRFVLGSARRSNPYRAPLQHAVVAPADRMREYILALQAIWRCWQTGGELQFESRHYRHTLMTPMFSPEPNPHGTPRVMVAAVGPRMTTVPPRSPTGCSCTGSPRSAICTTSRCAGRCRSGDLGPWARTDFTTVYPGLVVTGRTEREFEDAAGQVRRQIAFYGATAAYRGVLDVHGWGDLHTELHNAIQGRQVGGHDDADRRRDARYLRRGRRAGQGRSSDRGALRCLIDRFTLYTPYPRRRRTCGHRRGSEGHRSSALSGGRFQQELADVGAGLIGVERLEHRRRRITVEPLEDGAGAEGRPAGHAHRVPGHVHDVVGDKGLGQAEVREPQFRRPQLVLAVDEILQVW